MFDFLEIQFWRIAKLIIRKGYGADCPDYSKGCASCKARTIIHWIDEHIELIKKFR